MRKYGPECILDSSCHSPVYFFSDHVLIFVAFIWAGGPWWTEVGFTITKGRKRRVAMRWLRVVSVLSWEIFQRAGWKLWVCMLRSEVEASVPLYFLILLAMSYTKPATFSCISTCSFDFKASAHCHSRNLLQIWCGVKRNAHILRQQL